MLNNFLKSFLINSILLVSISVNSYVQAESSLCLSRGYENPNQLIGDSCMVLDAIFATSGDEYVATTLTMMSFRDTSQGVNSLSDINLFFSGSKKACLHCSGTTESELKAAEKKLLEQVNAKRSEYGATLYRDVVVNNQISASELTFGTDENLLTCSEEIEQLDSDCQVSFKKSLKSLAGFEGIKFKENRDKNVDTSDVFRTLKNNTLLRVAGTRRAYGMHMYTGVPFSYDESKVSSTAQVDSTFKAQALFLGSGQSESKEDIASKLFTYKGALINYYKTQESFVDKLSKTSSDDFDSYCSGKDNKFIESVSSEIDILDSYASLKGRINKEWICNSFEAGDFDPKRIKNKSLKKILNSDNYRKDLKERIKGNCQKQFKEIEETICRSKKKVDPSVFYNSKSIYSKEPFEMLTRDLEDENEILAFRALACIYHDQAGEAANNASGNSLGGSGHSDAVSKMMNLTGSGTSAAQGFLSSASGSKSGSTARLVDELGEYSDIADTTSSSDTSEDAKVDKVDTSDPFAFFNQNNQNMNNTEYPTYNPSIPSSQILDDSNDLSETEKKMRDEEKVLSDEIAELQKKREELEKKLAADLAADKEKIDQKKFDNMLKEKQELDDKIAKLKNKKEEVVTARTEIEEKINEQQAVRVARVSTTQSRVPASVNNTTSSQTVGLANMGESETVKEQSTTSPTSSGNYSDQSSNQSTAGLEIIYNKKLDELLTSTTSGKPSDQGMLELIKEMADNNIPLNFKIESRDGVKTIIFPDLNREIKLSEFEPKIQKEFQKYISSSKYTDRQIANSDADKRETTLIDLNEDLSVSESIGNRPTYEGIILKYKEAKE